MLVQQYLWWPCDAPPLTLDPSTATCSSFCPTVSMQLYNTSQFSSHNSSHQNHQPVPLQTIGKAAKIGRCGTQNWTAQSRSQSQTHEKQCPIATSERCVHSVLCATRFVLQSLMKIIFAKAHSSCPHTTKATEHPQLSNAHPWNIQTSLDLSNLIRLQSWI